MGENLKLITYKMTVSSDSGKFNIISETFDVVGASDYSIKEAAINKVCLYEDCPRCAITNIKEIRREIL